MRGERREERGERRGEERREERGLSAAGVGALQRREERGLSAAGGGTLQRWVLAPLGARASSPHTCRFYEYTLLVES